MKVKINKISRKERISARTNKPFISVGIQVSAPDEYAGKWLSGFENETTKNWREGDEVEIEVERKGDFLNFSLPKLMGSSNAEVKNMITLKVMPLLEEIHERQKNMETRLQARLDRIDFLLKSEEKDDTVMPDFDEYYKNDAKPQ